MLTRQFRFGRTPAIGAVAICALAAGWTAGQRAHFVAGHREEPSSISLPLAPERDSKGPTSPKDANSFERGRSRQVLSPSRRRKLAYSRRTSRRNKSATWPALPRRSRFIRPATLRVATSRRQPQKTRLSRRRLNGSRCGAFRAKPASSGCRPSCRRIRSGPRSTG